VAVAGARLSAFGFRRLTAALCGDRQDRHVIRRLLAVLIVLVPACSAPGSDPTVAVPPPAPSSTTSTTGSDPVLEEPPLSIVRIDDPSFVGGVLNGVVAAGPGFVAVGFDELPEDAAVWVSADGLSWERVTSEDFSGVEDDFGVEGAQEMNDVAVGQIGIVAVGSYERRPERDVDAGVWISSDGLSWERIEDEDLGGTGFEIMHSVAMWNGMIVAVGETAGPVGSGELRPAVWTSTDGRSWDRAEGIVFRFDAIMHAVVDAGDQVVVVGSSGHVARPTVWLSEDGATWNAIGLVGLSAEGVDTGPAGRLDDLPMLAVIPLADGYAAAGRVGENAQAVFWTSLDALEWDATAVLADYDRPGEPVVVEAMTATEWGLVAVGTATLDATRFPPLSLAEVWVSSDDGLTWTQIPRSTTSLATSGPGAPWHVGSMRDVIEIDGGVLMVGHVPIEGASLPGPFFRQAVWLAERR
jgi:hypothetical protein